jgi:polyferredoxin
LALGKRKLVQLILAVLSNLYLTGFWQGKIYTGDSKRLCSPGLNCYSCPGAIASCPIGALQAVIGSGVATFSFYVTGLLTIFGVLFGRLICGWACPFGLFQELLNKIPSPKLVTIKGIKYLKYLKYLFLAFSVLIFPFIIATLTGYSDPYFCKYICPTGTLEGGIPLVLLNNGLRDTLGFLYVWKMFILAITIIMSIFIFRPFCRFVCPLGAIYGLFNRVSFYKIRFNSNLCISCGNCTRACESNLEVIKSPNNPECIRCGDCIKSCPKKALSIGIDL